MKKGTMLNRWIAVLCALILTVSLFAIPAFAEETESSSESESESVSESVSESESESETESASESGSESSTETESESTSESTGSSNNTNNTNKDSFNGTLVWIIVLGIVVIVGAILCVKFREKLGKSLRVYKSEAKKIVWLPWDQTKKSTIVVIIILIICAAVICLLDYVLQQGILAFLRLF